MLHYAPDCLVPDDFALACADWAVAWEGEGLPDGDLLSGVIAASREKIIRTCGARAHIGKAVQGAFQPERVSGFCAAG